MNNISSKPERLIELALMVNVTPQWLIEVVDVYNEANQNGSEHLTEIERRVRLIDRESDECFAIGEWEADFVSNVRLAQFNKRMIKRLVRGVRGSL